MSVYNNCSPTLSGISIVPLPGQRVHLFLNYVCRFNITLSSVMTKTPSTQLQSEIFNFIH